MLYYDIFDDYSQGLSVVIVNILLSKYLFYSTNTGNVENMEPVRQHMSAAGLATTI